MQTVRRRARNLVVLGIEKLEQRLALAGNITIYNAFLVNSNDQPLTGAANAGEDVYVQADYYSSGLPSNASYRFDISVNGLTLYTSYATLGAGSPGTTYGYFWWGSFIATPGTNQVLATADPAGYAANTLSYTFNAVSPAVGSYMSYTVAQIRAAYGINSIPNFGSATADGSGQTIAIVDAGNDPSILTDLDGFDQAMSLTTTSSETLYQQYGPASSILTVYNQNGTNITADIGTSGSNGVPSVINTAEITLDVEWAHAIAPGAKIDLVETNSLASGPVGDAVGADLPGVSVVSNSWALDEFSGETADDSDFVTPSGHTGVTFLASSGDSGADVYYPAASPNVIAVGGTQLSLDNNAYAGEIGWSFPTPRTLNYDSSSYSQTGSWASEGNGFSGAYGVAARDTSASATWTTAISSADEGWLDGVEVSATWTASPSDATNATYTIYDGTQASGKVLGTVVVNQTQSPVGTADGSYQFQELGDFFPTSGTVTVVLNANTANGSVVADAIGIAPGWAGSGGQSQFEPEPSYQLPIQSTGKRTTPDVSFDAAASTGVACYQNGALYYDYYGTSLACPCWAGLIAIVNQGRVAAGATTLNSSTNSTQALQFLYSLPSSDFNDITSGYNGHEAGAGYDQVTGLGTPIANNLVPALVGMEVVTNTLDSGADSLRQALLGAPNWQGFAATILFELPTGPQTIDVLSSLPSLSVPLDVQLGANLNLTITSSSQTILNSFDGLTKTGAGTLTITGDNGLSGTVGVNAGSLTFDDSVAPALAPGVAVAVSASATLDLAGSISDLSAAVNITNNSTASDGVVVSGTNQVVGVIDGTGNLVIDAHSGLTVDSIDQNSIVLGTGASLTIAPSSPETNTVETNTVESTASDPQSATSSDPAVAARLAAIAARREAEEAAAVVLFLAGSPTTADDASTAVPYPTPAPLDFNMAPTAVVPPSAPQPGTAAIALFATALSQVVTIAPAQAITLQSVGFSPIVSTIAATSSLLGFAADMGPPEPTDPAAAAALPATGSVPAPAVTKSAVAASDQGTVLTAASNDTWGQFIVNRAGVDAALAEGDAAGPALDASLLDLLAGDLIARSAD